MDEEAEPKVMQGELRDELAGRRARAQAPRDLPAHPGPELVVAPEEHAALRGDGPRLRLADVVQECAEPERASAGEVVGKRAFELANHRCRVRAEDGLRVPLD